jgi:hypothetical protein
MAEELQRRHPAAGVGGRWWRRLAR